MLQIWNRQLIPSSWKHLVCCFCCQLLFNSSQFWKWLSFLNFLIELHLMFNSMNLIISRTAFHFHEMLEEYSSFYAVLFNFHAWSSSWACTEAFYIFFITLIFGQCSISELSPEESEDVLFKEVLPFSLICTLLYNLICCCMT